MIEAALLLDMFRLAAEHRSELDERGSRSVFAWVCLKRIIAAVEALIDEGQTEVKVDMR